MKYFVNLKNLARELKIGYRNFEHLDINIIKKSFNNLSQEKLKNIIIDDVKKNKNFIITEKNIKTPDVIVTEKDFDFFHEISSEENYITEKNILGELIVLKDINNFDKLRDKIVLIESADPGYDFIFSYNISLITKYGGRNSHMSIRSNELNLPSIIGVEKNYNNIIAQKKLY